MATEQRLPPSAASLSASMRDLGYTLEAAIADIVDNSISAKATVVEIFCNLADDPPFLAILDNGVGMERDEIIKALRHGTRSPNEVRNPFDLGRFGLGLKTASFSQCKKLTVLSRSDESGLSGAEWDLDLVDERDDWIIRVLDDADLVRMPFVERLDKKGTMVLWRNLDRLFEDEAGDLRAEVVNDKLDIVEKHLALVFHRFLSGTIKGRKNFSIVINGHQIEPFDPFCSKNSATQVLPEEAVRVKGQVVKIQPYILPHHSKLSAAEYDFYQDRSDFISHQGAYIYRSGRLMAWGDWFRLIAKGEATKLARVQIDFPNSLDQEWTINIKKSRAKPPRAVRERLRQIIEQIAHRSTKVHRGRGQRLFNEIQAPVWERYADQGAIRYDLNREHPLMQALLTTLDEQLYEKLNMLLSTISSALPIEMIYSDYSTNPREIVSKRADANEIKVKLIQLYELLCANGELNKKQFQEVVRSTRLFEDHLQTTEELIEEMF